MLSFLAFLHPHPFYSSFCVMHLFFFSFFQKSKQVLQRTLMPNHCALQVNGYNMCLRLTIWAFLLPFSLKINDLNGFLFQTVMVLAEPAPTFLLTWYLTAWPKVSASLLYLAVSFKCTLYALHAHRLFVCFRREGD